MASVSVDSVNRALHDDDEAMSPCIWAKGRNHAWYCNTPAGRNSPFGARADKSLEVFPESERKGSMIFSPELFSMTWCSVPCCKKRYPTSQSACHVTPCDSTPAYETTPLVQAFESVSSRKDACQSKLRHCPGTLHFPWQKRIVSTKAAKYLAAQKGFKLLLSALQQPCTCS